MVDLFFLVCEDAIRRPLSENQGESALHADPPGTLLVDFQSLKL